jgi:hypothetical protein
MLTFIPVFDRRMRSPARTSTSVWNGTRIKPLRSAGLFGMDTSLPDVRI